MIVFTPIIHTGTADEIKKKFGRWFKAGWTEIEGQTFLRLGGGSDGQYTILFWDRLFVRRDLASIIGMNVSYD